MASQPARAIVAILLVWYSPAVHAWMIGQVVQQPASRRIPYRYSCRPTTRQQGGSTAATSKDVSPLRQHDCSGRSSISSSSSTTLFLKLPDNEDIDEFLDTPFFDPDAVLDDDESNLFAKKFAAFVKNDYEIAEGLLAGGFFVFLVVLSQELLRMQVYGANYVPFSEGSNGLF